MRKTLQKMRSRKPIERYQFGFDGPNMGSGFDFGGFGGASMNMDDIFSMFGDIFGGHGFGGFGGGSRRPQQHRGSDLRLKVKLTLEEINKGVTKKFKVRKDVPAAKRLVRPVTDRVSSPTPPRAFSA